ncbi:hypothetical protein MTO96_034386, partial [Rhipicephalus appendiculatus]
MQERVQQRTESTTAYFHSNARLCREVNVEFTDIKTANPPKRALQPNFTQPELAALVDGYEEYRRAIESRGEGPRGSQAKQRAWETITANLFVVSGIVRTPSEVSKKWCNVKSTAKAR